MPVCRKVRWAIPKWVISISVQAESFIRISLVLIRRSGKANYREIRVLQKAFAETRGHRLHLLGLVSDGGVHSHYEHLFALADTAKQAGVEEIFVHAITDGRDASPTGGAKYLATCAKD